MNKEESEIARKRKAQILDAAAECFRVRGFHRSSMARISEAAEMSSGHIYHYFKSKEDIVAAIVERDRSEISVLQSAAAANPGQDVMDLFIDQLSHAVSIHKDLKRASLTIEILAEAARNPAIAAVVHRNDAEFHTALQELVGDDSRETRSRLEIVAALLAGLSVRALRNPKLEEDLDFDMLKRVVRFIHSV
ncbi:TetR/AcrR family transcriptional regulator [Corticibacter populi]|uniref:TetR/AcrR family transcriptional regulator n=1 Tax=Corticibacter populi TaxID=1550736 RepID=A0A3M6QS60_9BURK|nr:TetR/AcrR family transcriptional regulator [Corticibacter populi]RMX05823.1 TetR/AcrR family transcriptional regulator [Corticibacter populi]RZS30864.1 TetR family transcriptional regulator [Corticibacter populi]